MNIPEFKAWFEGFTANIDGVPTAEQFEKIKAKVDELAVTPIPTPRPDALRPHPLKDAVSPWHDKIIVRYGEKQEWAFPRATHATQTLAG